MVTLYTTHCPKCQVLEAKLQDKNIEYRVIDDIDILSKCGFLSVPVLELPDERVLKFREAVEWVNEQ